MILVDVNILLYASFEDVPQHRAASEWLAAQFDGPSRIGLPWDSLLAFLRITTHPRIIDRPLMVSVAWQQVQSWLASDQVWIPLPTERHAEVLGKLISQSDVHGNLIHDAHLAALAIEHGLTLCSTDGDFARFRELKWINPLAP